LTTLIRSRLRVRGELVRALACAAAALAVVGFAQTGSGHSLLRSLGVVGDAERYTELSFVAPDALPARVSRGPVTMAPFRLHNVEAGARTYRWQVSIVAGPRREVAARGTIVVPRGATRDVAPPVGLACLAPRERIVVALLDPAESIDYLVGCPSRR
jgi:hypothetical protein